MIGGLCTEKKLIKNVIKKLSGFILPAFSAWLPAAYIVLLSYFNHIGNMPWMNIIYILLFIPIIFYEAAIDRIFSVNEVDGFRQYNTGSKKIRLWGKIFFWLVPYFLAVLVMPNDFAANRWLEFFFLSILPNLRFIYKAESYVTALFFLVWAIFYYSVTLRKRRFRILSSLVIPGVFTYLLFYHYYFMGGVGEASISRVEKQPGVSVFYSGDDFPRQDYYHYIRWREDYRLHPRDLHIDIQQNAIYANYANTYGRSSALATPNILRIDLNTKETKYYMGYYARIIETSSPDIIVSPWFKRKIYILDKNDLSVIREFSCQDNIYPWETSNIHYDDEHRFIYIANDMQAALLKYDYATGTLLGKLQPDEFKFGGAFWHIEISRLTGMMYLTGLGTKEELFEIDTDSMKIIRSLDLVKYGISAMLLDDENGLLYLQDGDTDKLYELELETFNVKRVIEGDVHSRLMCLDTKRGIIYILSFFYGRISAVSIESGQKLWSLKVGAKPDGLVLYEDILYVNSMTGIIKIDLKTVWNTPGK
ncbi:MAG: hypothetical protein ABIH89_06335 [Elusimicrobiota bacterium]